MFKNHYIYVQKSTNMIVNITSHRIIHKTILVTLLLFTEIIASGIGSMSFTTMRQIPDFPSRANCLFPDKDGYLWIGTKKGLFRFDGYECRRFSSIMPGHNTFDKEIIEVCADSFGHMWALSKENLIVYDKHSDSVKEFGISGTTSSPCKDGFLFGSGQSLYRFDFEAMNMEPITSFRDSFTTDFVTELPDGNILCGSYFNGLKIVNPITGATETPFSLEGVHITSMFVDSRGRLWLGLYNIGVRCYNMEGTLLASYSTHDSKMSNDIILSIVEKDGNMWMGTDGGGICILSPATGEIECLENRVGDDNSIPYNSIMKIIPDSYGNIWAIRVRGGVFVIRNMPMHIIKAVPSEKYGLSDNGVLCVYQENGQKDLWIGTDGGGVNLFNADSQEFKWFPSTLGMKIADISKYSEEKLMISSFSDGIFLFDKRDGHISKFTVRNQDMQNHIMYSGNALNLHDEISGSILLLSRSVYRYDPVSRSAQELSKPANFTSQPSAVRSSADRSFLYDSKRIYGVYYDSDSVDILHEVQPDIIISNVSYSGDNLLWVSTNRGVFSLNLSNGMSEPLKTDLFSSSATIASDGGHVWIGTDNAIYLWDNDFERFKSYNFPQSAYPNEFRPKATIVSQDGNVFLGGMDGLLVIDSTEPPTSGPIPEIVLSDVSVDSRKRPGISMGGNLKVKWTTASINVDVHAKGDDLFANRMFLFRINERDTVKQHSPSFTLRSLSPGRYAIDVACASSGGIHTSWSRVLTLTVMSPWYKSQAFSIILVLLFATAIVFLSARWNYNMRKNMKEELDHLKQKSEDETFLLRLKHCVQLNLNEPDMDINMICRELGVSHTSLFKRVKQITGSSIKEYIDGIRMERAEELVKFTDLSFTEIAGRIGFVSSRYFSTFFKRKTGMTPSECRMSANGKSTLPSSRGPAASS